MTWVAAVHVEIVIVRKNKAVLNAEICQWSKVDGQNRVQSKRQLILIWGIPV